MTTPDPSSIIPIQDAALIAARDCRSRKVRARLRAAMNAVLRRHYAQVPEEYALMVAVEATMRVVDDISLETLKAEMAALAQLSLKLQGHAVSEESTQMPKNAIGVLGIWETARQENGLFRPPQAAE